jgi:hypothetical protein
MLFIFLLIPRFLFSAFIDINSSDNEEAIILAQYFLLLNVVRI